MARKTQSAFTLIELLVVVAVLAILSAIALYNFALAADRARQVECASRLKTIGYALYAYRLDHNNYPVAAIWTTGPAERMPEAFFEKMAPVVVERAERVSKKLGYGVLKREGSAQWNVSCPP